MINKNIAIFFLFLANSVLLAHVVVPHHHNNYNMVCVAKSFCHHDKNEHEHKSAVPHHDHKGENSSESCFLKQFVVIPSNQIKQGFNIAPDSKKHLLFSDYQSIINYARSDPFNPIIETNTPIPLIIFSYTFFAVTSIGLRAPPVV